MTSRFRLHPLDIAAARRQYVVATCLRALAHPTCLVASALALWSVSNNAVTPLLGPAIGLAICAYVERSFRWEAWAYVAGRHQDLGRDDPIGIAVPTALLRSGSLVAATTLYIGSSTDTDSAMRAAPVAFGMLIGLLLIDIAFLSWDGCVAPARRVDLFPPGVSTGTAVLTPLVTAGATWVVATRTEWQWLAGLGGLLAVLLYTAATLTARQVPSRWRCVPTPLARP